MPLSTGATAPKLSWPYFVLLYAVTLSGNLSVIYKLT